ncbi:MAG: hypothetical protein LIO78_01080 [Clostridiales bacterium]|nr:hypothetical protein [Clostridiales bacterium]
MQDKKKADGFKYDFTLSELKTLLFHSKKMPEVCGATYKRKDLRTGGGPGCQRAV